jgi:hypothetical protein
MQIELKSLKPNPMRDLRIDPIDDETVATLKESIKEHGFWGGVVCRRMNGHVEIAAGHHRVKAALAAGIREADVFIGEMDDAEMIRIYATENATQRGNSGTAQAGTVASAIRFLVKGILTGNVSGFPDTSRKSLETIKLLQRKQVAVRIARPDAPGRPQAQRPVRRPVARRLRPAGRWLVAAAGHHLVEAQSNAGRAL